MQPDAIQSLTRSGDSAHSFLSRPELALAALRAGELWALRRKDVDPLRGVLHVRQTVKRDVASRDADRATVTRTGARSAGPRTART